MTIASENCARFAGRVDLTASWRDADAALKAATEALVAEHPERAFKLLHDSIYRQWLLEHGYGEPTLGPDGKKARARGERRAQLMLARPSRRTILAVVR